MYFFSCRHQGKTGPSTFRRLLADAAPKARAPRRRCVAYDKEDVWCGHHMGAPRQANRNSVKSANFDEKSLKLISISRVPFPFHSHSISIPFPVCFLSWQHFEALAALALRFSPSTVHCWIRSGSTSSGSAMIRSMSAPWRPKIRPTRLGQGFYIKMQNACTRMRVMRVALIFLQFGKQLVSRAGWRSTWLDPETGRW